MNSYFGYLYGSQDVIEYPHARIHYQCCACSERFKAGDAIVALISEDNVIRPYNAGHFTQYRGCDQLEGVRYKFCKHECATCSSGEETATVHTDCFNLFKKECPVGDKYRRLWIAARALYPWRGAQPLLLPLQEYGLWEIARPMLNFKDTLPPELWETIQSLSSPHHTWRFCSVIRLARELEMFETDVPIIFPLYRIVSWTRGCPLEHIDEGLIHHAAMRLTFDARGLKNIERIRPEELMMAGSFANSSHLLFISQWTVRLAGIDVNFQAGRARLNVTMTQPIHLWDTKIPLDVIEFMPRTPGRMRLATIDTDPRHCTGVSFFSLSNSIVAIFAHTKGQPNIVEQFRYYNQAYNTKIIWTYVPITADDEITAVGRMSSTGEFFNELYGPIVLQKKKTGKIIVGTNMSLIRFEVMCIADQSARKYPIFVHQISYPFFPVGFVGISPLSQKTREPVPLTQMPLGDLENVSTASLNNVASAKLFGDLSTGYTKGILLKYRDGTKSALGQCRVGLDSVQVFTKVSRIHFSRANFLRQGRWHETAFVSFANVPVNPDDDNPLKWRTYTMEGRLEVLFTLYDFKIKVVDGVEI